LKGRCVGQLIVTILVQYLQLVGVEGEVCGSPISFLLDTGAAVTLLRKDTWERVNARGEHSLSPWLGQ
jgi:hypothetical protein